MTLVKITIYQNPDCGEFFSRKISYPINLPELPRVNDNFFLSLKIKTLLEERIEKSILKDKNYLFYYSDYIYGSLLEKITNDVPLRKIKISKEILNENFSLDDILFVHDIVFDVDEKDNCDIFVILSQERR